VERRSTCRVCAGTLQAVLSLGDHHVSAFPLPHEGDGVRAPLALALCRKCRLLQLEHTVSADLMYRNYWYRSGTNQSMRDSLAEIAHVAERLVRLRADDAVLDIGCNDGTLLASYQTGGIYKVGFDPAENMAAWSRKVASRVVTSYFTAEAYAAEPDLRGRAPRLVTSIAMFYDLEDPRKFVADVKKVMHPDGLWIVQMSYLPLMLKQRAFDNVCHEHLEYYSLESFEYLLRLHDFEVADVELNDVNGGSMRAYIRNRAASEAAFGDATYRSLATERTARVREQEAALGLGGDAPYREFAFWVERVKQDVVGFVKDRTAAGRTVDVYGASTKGNTLLQYYGLDHTLIRAAAERNPDKWGRVTVGTRIPIVSEDEARARRPDYFLVLPWHFMEEFQAREQPYLLAGGRFIVPLPRFALI
jgi:NDP-4-keto-2,6-dideoxyhexose 3-C-methyltransferase